MLLLILIITVSFFIKSKMANINVKLVKNIRYLLQKYGVVPRANWGGSFAGSDTIDIFMLISNTFFPSHNFYDVESQSEMLIKRGLITTNVIYCRDNVGRYFVSPPKWC